MCKFVMAGCLVLTLLSMVSPAWGDDQSAPKPGWLDVIKQPATQPATSQPSIPGTGGVEKIGGPEPEWQKPIPLSVVVEYCLCSDYIFRGINFSEYPGEGRELPNNQLTTAFKYDLKEFGKVGATFWFEWFAGQEHLTPGQGDLQEVDYTAYYQYTIDSIATTLEAGYIEYTFPPLHGDAANDSEVYLKGSWDDSKLWGTKAPVLNPYLAWYQDVDLAEGATWWEAGVSHDFALADMGQADTPILKNIVVSPSVVLGAQHNYYGKLGVSPTQTTQLANVLYGLQVKYNLGQALNMPAKYGNIYIAPFVAYSEALDTDALKDWFYGGVKVGWEW